MKMKAKLALAIAGSMMVASVASAGIVWSDASPNTPSGTTTGNNMGAVAGTLDFNTANAWVSLQGVDTLDVGEVGQDINWSFDIYVPAAAQAAHSASAIYPAMTTAGSGGAWFNLNHGLIVADTWSTLSGTWVGGNGAVAGESGLIVVYNNSGLAGTADGIQVANVQFEAIPEPATIGLMGLAGLAIYFKRKIS